MLLVAAGLMIRSFLKMQELSAAFQNEKILTMWVYLSGANYLTPEPRVRFLERLEEELRTVPGTSIAMASSLPLSGGFTWDFEVEGRPVTDPKDRPSALGLEITTDYFEALGIPILQGRSFRLEEGREGRTAVIVNQRLAQRYWPGENVIGKRLRMVRADSDLRVASLEQPLLSVVGVVPDVRQNFDPNAPIEPVMYVPYRQGQMARAMAIIARTSGGDAHSLTPILRTAVQRANSAMPVIDVRTLPEHFENQRWFQRVFGITFTIFGIIGLFLALVGIYAVFAYSVTERTQEIGIRISLGAQRGAILRMVVGHALNLALIGVVTGLAASYAVTRVMTTLLVGISATDTITFVVVAIGLSIVAVLASYVPARRASRVDPIIALRGE
jgi:putative ABC transport system permease protein